MRLTEKDLVHVILCEPFTTKGFNRVKNLHLEKQLTKEFVIKNGLLIDGANSYGQVHSEGYDPNLAINAGYTTPAEQRRRHQTNFITIDQQFVSMGLADGVLTFTAVVGNGKSIEIYRRLYQSEKENGVDSAVSSVILDLEISKAYVTRDTQYNCPNRDNSLWLFCTTLLNGVIEYIEANKSQCEEIAKRFFATEALYIRTTPEQKAVFSDIKELAVGWPESTKKVFDSVLNLLRSKDPGKNKNEDAKKDIESLLDLLAMLMYCQDPNHLHYIVIDNLEQYVKLTQGKRIQILDTDIKEIFAILRGCNNNMFKLLASLSEVEDCPVKIIFAIRRTSKRLLGLNYLTGDEFKENAFHDITGHTHIYDIWDKKLEKVWRKETGSIGLAEQYDSYSGDVIDILTWMMSDRPNDRFGGSYQALIAGLMSQGLRRIAKAEAGTAFKMYEYLTDNDYTIDYEQFKRFQNERNATTYLLRRALVQCQIRRFIEPREGNRWKELNIGYVTPETQNKNLGWQRTVEIQNADYLEQGTTTLTWRILAALSRHYGLHEETSIAAYPVEVFDTVPLVQLMREVLLAPQDDPAEVNIRNKPIRSFARTIYALGNMSFRETEGSPFIIVMFGEPLDSEEDLANALAEMWEASYLNEKPKRYDPVDYCVRITEAGYCFVFDWIASFSYMAALKCYAIPPLVLLKDRNMIELVLDSVFQGSKQMLDQAIRETEWFTKVDDRNTTLKWYGLQVGAGREQISLLTRVKSLHTDYLRLYRDHINKHGDVIFDDFRDKTVVLRKIESVITSYNNYGVVRVNDKFEPKQCF